MYLLQHAQERKILDEVSARALYDLDLTQQTFVRSWELELVEEHVDALLHIWHLEHVTEELLSLAESRDRALEGLQQRAFVLRGKEPLQTREQLGANCLVVHGYNRANELLVLVVDLEARESERQVVGALELDQLDILGLASR